MMFENFQNVQSYTANRVLSDAELLHYAKTVKFTIAVCVELQNIQGTRFTKVMTLSEHV